MLAHVPGYVTPSDISTAIAHCYQATGALVSAMSPNDLHAEWQFNDI
jgi:hypothetical protein